MWRRLNIVTHTQWRTCWQVVALRFKDAKAENYENIFNDGLFKYYLMIKLLIGI